MIKYERPKLVEITDLGATEGGGCENGSVNTESCGGGGTVVPSCVQGGIPSAIKR